MPEIRRSIVEYDKLIAQADALKTKIIEFKGGGKGLDIKQSKTLQLLESAADHIIENLKRLKQRILTDLEGD